MKSIKRAYITVIIIAVINIFFLDLFEVLHDLFDLWSSDIRDGIREITITAIFVIIVIICVEMIYKGYIDEKNGLGFFEKYIGAILVLLVLLILLVLLNDKHLHHIWY